MSCIKEMKCKSLRNMKVMVESFSSAKEVVDLSKSRPITDSSFTDYSAPGAIDSHWAGVKDMNEAYHLMEFGYEPTIDALSKSLNPSISGSSKRTQFRNDVVGFAPIVPLALQGIPNCMRNSYTKPMKSKVINVYYDMTANCSVSSEDIIKAGQKLLATIIKLEHEGYKYNLNSIQTYSDESSVDMLCTRIKNSNSPLDLRRMSFPLTHTGFFRAIGFDWYSRTPKGKHRSGYGRGLGYRFTEEELAKGFEEIFNEKCVVFNASKLIKYSEEHLEKILTLNS